MKEFKVYFKILTLFMLLTPLAWAKGPGSGNGGNGALSEDESEVRFLDLLRKPGTIVYSHKRSAPYQLLKSQMAKHDGFREATYFPYNYDEPTESISRKVISALNRLTFFVVTDGTRLPDPHDAGIVVLPWDFNGQIVRLALQDIETGKVLVDGESLAKMQPIDIAALFQHEALIRVWYDDPHQYILNGSLPARYGRLESTEKIADIVHMTFVSTAWTQNLSAEAVAAKMCEAGIRVNSRSLKGLRKIKGTSAHSNPMPENFFAYGDEGCEVHQFRTTKAWDVRDKRNLSRSKEFLEILHLEELVENEKFKSVLVHEGYTSSRPPLLMLDSGRPRSRLLKNRGPLDEFSLWGR